MADASRPMSQRRKMNAQTPENALDRELALSRVGGDLPLQDGERVGQAATGAHWRLSIHPYEISGIMSRVACISAINDGQRAPTEFVNGPAITNERPSTA